jgi:hypothetical protein
VGKYDGWATFFDQLEGTQHEIPLDVLEGMVDGHLPPSATSYKAWWAGDHYYATWRAAGWFASLQPTRGTVRFTKESPSRGRPRVAERSGSATHPGTRPIPPDGMRLVLLGCVAQKRSDASPARDLYVSALWDKRRRYAESTEMPWAVLSAEHGLLDPATVIAPYDRYLERETRAFRQAWSEQVATLVIERCRALDLSAVEVHAGSAYLEFGLINALEQAGITVAWPLHGRRIGEQLHWYDDIARAASPRVAAETRVPVVKGADARFSVTGDHARGVAAIYRSGVLGEEGWAELPEVWARPDAEPREQRLWMTFVAAVDRARDADALWRAAREAWTHDAWVFDPTATVARSFIELADALRRYGLSQRHMPDAAAWRTIAESLASPTCPSAIRAAIEGVHVDAGEVLAALRSRSPDGTPLFPQLSGPKIGPMWVRMLAYPGEAPIRGMRVIPVAVDTHVQRVTEMLGLVEPRVLDDAHRGKVQQVWFEATDDAGSFGAPSAIDGTAAGLDPALWALGRKGCSACERARAKIRLGDLCDLCVLGRVAPVSESHHDAS